MPVKRTTENSKVVAIAGAGFSGTVLARELAETGKYRVVVFEERSHLAGNCHTVRDKNSGIMIHEYGPHIFHTNREDVWNYVNRFAEFGAYTNRVKAITGKGVFSLPINLLTINQFFGKQFSPNEAKEFIFKQSDQTILEPKTFEDQALKFVGRELYEAFFKGYTEKQWGVSPRELPASILQRLPVRFNYDDNYYSSRYQGIPLDGYTAIVEKLVDHPAIEVRLGERFVPAMKHDFDHVFFSGPIDSFFEFNRGRLQYRSLVFERYDDVGDFQGNAVINYCDKSAEFTRISEHKHFAPWEEHEATVYFREYSKLTEPGDTPFYPLRLGDDKKLLEEYIQQLSNEENVTFIGRLGTYRYLDMHVVIGESLDLAAKCKILPREAWPRLSFKMA